MHEVFPYHVAVHHSLVLPPLQHVAVPLYQALGLGDLLLTGVAVEDVVVSLAWGTCPNMGSAEPVIAENKACTTHAHPLIPMCTHTEIHVCTHPHAHPYSRSPTHSPLSLHKFHVANDYLVIHECPVLPRLEEVHTVQVGDIHTPEGGGEGG